MRFFLTHSKQLIFQIPEIWVLESQSSYSVDRCVSPVNSVLSQVKPGAVAAAALWCVNSTLDCWQPGLIAALLLSCYEVSLISHVLAY